MTIPPLLPYANHNEFTAGQSMGNRHASISMAANNTASSSRGKRTLPALLQPRLAARIRPSSIFSNSSRSFSARGSREQIVRGDPQLPGQPDQGLHGRLPPLLLVHSQCARTDLQTLCQLCLTESRLPAQRPAIRVPNILPLLSCYWLAQGYHKKSEKTGE